MLHRLINYVQRAYAGRELVSASLWSLVVRGSGALLTFILGVILARSLGPDDFGVYGMVIAMAFLLSVLGQAGLPTLSTRELAVASSRHDWPLVKGIVLTFGSVVVFASILGGALLTGTALFVPHLFGSQSIAFAIGGSLVPLFAATVLVVAMLRGFSRTVLSQSIEILIRPAITLLCLVGFLLTARLDAATALGLSSLASLVTLVIALLYLFRTIPRAAHDAARMNKQADWARAAWPMATIEVLRQVEGSYGILLIGVLASDSAAGFFRLAFSIMMVAVTPLGILHMVLAPTLARLSANRETEGLSRVLAISATLMFLAASLPTAVLCLVGKPLIAMIFGEIYVGAWLPLIVLMVAQMLTGFCGLGSMLLAMGGGERELTIAYVVSLTIAGIIAIPLISRYGATGAAAAAVAGAAVLNFFVWRAIKHRFGIDCSLFGALLQWRKL